MKHLTGLKLYSLVFLLISYCFTTTSFTPHPKDSIVGFWYYNGLENDIETYVKHTPQKRARTIAFNKDGSTSLSFCTDRCSCERVTYLGTWKRLNDSTIQVIYTQEESAFEGHPASLLPEQKVDTFSIKAIERKQLKMNRL